MALSTEPKSTNFLSPLGGKFTIKKLPSVNFFVQSVAIPSVTVGEIPIGTPFSAKLQLPRDLVTFGDLVITFRVDENMENYLEIFNWIKGITRIDNFDDSVWGNEVAAPMSDDKVYSDGTLTILNSAMNPNRFVKFKDMFPTSLGDLPFRTDLSDVDYIECTATFKYRMFDIETTG